MNEESHEARRFRVGHPGARVVVGLIAAGAGLAAAGMVFGPLADEQTRMLAAAAPQRQTVADPQRMREVRLAAYRAEHTK